MKYICYHKWMATVEPDHGDILVMWLPKEIPELIYIEELLSWAATAYRKNDVSTFSLLLMHRFAHCNRLCLKEKSWHRRLYKHQCQMNTKWFLHQRTGKAGGRAYRYNVPVISWLEKGSCDFLSVEWIPPLRVCTLQQKWEIKHRLG